jgi:hypothetical protein
MDALLGKLTNLAYEVFGVIIPGLVFGVFLLMWWFALGPLVPYWTWSRVPELTLAELWLTVDAVPGGRTTASAILILMACYFLGHSVNWTSKARPREKSGWATRLERVSTFLTFRVPRPKESYDPQLQRLFEAVSGRWTHDGRLLSWREFYPLAKTVLANTGRHSLIATYQNKYTLHRSIAAAAAFLFWLSVFSTLGAIVAAWQGIPAQPDWALMLGLWLGSILLVTGFSATYSYAWTLWGDTVITESYALAFGPRMRSTDGIEQQSDRD